MSSFYIVLDTTSLTVATDEEGNPEKFESFDEAEEYGDLNLQFSKVVFID